MTFWLINDFFIIHHFKILAPRLLELKIRMNCLPGLQVNHRTSFVDHFQKALSHLNLLTSLTIKCNRRKMFTDISFLSQMKQLQSFNYDDFYDGDQKDIYHHLSSLPHLYFLKSNHTLGQKTSDSIIEMICAKSEQFSKLRHLGHFYCDDNNQYHYFQLLSHLPSLESIDISMVGVIEPDIKIPSLLGKWIHNLSFGVGNLSEEQISNLIQLPHLKSLKLYSLTINNSKLQKLIRGLSSKLEVLALSPQFTAGYLISFEDLATCTRLKTLWLNFIEIRGEFDLIRKFDHLESLIIDKCIIHDISSSLKIQTDFKVPSILFPMMQLCRIILL
jgi:hypothetical protein